jgi:membrane protein YqaA with SNARE-associated domain
LADKSQPKAPTGVTDEIIEAEIQAHWTARLMRPVRRLYEWTLHWAETKYATTALAITAFSESIWFPIPVDPLLVALCLGKPKRSFWYAINCTFWSTVGAMTAMLLGAWIGEERVLAMMAVFHLDEEARWALDQFREYGFWAVAVGAIAPAPYKIFAWIAGFADVNWLSFLAATVIFRKVRYMLIGTLVYFYGVRARHFIDKYFNLICALTGAALILVLLAMKYREAIGSFFSGLFGG